MSCWGVAPAAVILPGLSDVRQIDYPHALLGNGSVVTFSNGIMAEPHPSVPGL